MCTVYCIVLVGISISQLNVIRIITQTVVLFRIKRGSKNLKKIADFESFGLLAVSIRMA